MDSSTLCIIVFLVTTAIYFFVKPTPATMMDPSLTPEAKANAEKAYGNQKFASLLIYFVVNVICQTAINASSIISMCGGSGTKSIGVAALFTLVPWVFIFGIMMALLIAIPAWKSAFANVVGYYVVYNRANEILNQLYDIPADIQMKIDGEKTTDPEQKVMLRKAAASVVKMMTNPSIVINYMVPENFEKFWETTLVPLMKEEYTKGAEPEAIVDSTIVKKGGAGADLPTLNPTQNDANSPAIKDAKLPTPKVADLPTLKKELFTLVVRRDNIGEMIWYLYTGLLLCIVVPYNIAKRGCKKDPQALSDSIQSYKDEQAAAVQDQVAAGSTVYL